MIGLVRAAAHQLRQHQIVRSVDLIAQFEAHPPGVDVFFLELIGTVLRESGASGTGQRGEFQHLDRRVGIAEDIAVVPGDGNDIGPLLALGGLHCGNRLAFEAARLLDVRPAGGQSQR